MLCRPPDATATPEAILRAADAVGTDSPLSVVLDYAPDHHDGLSATVAASTPHPPHVVAARPEKFKQSMTQTILFACPPSRSLP